MERLEARKLGFIRYNTGRMCRNGHNCDRYVASGECILCIRSYQRRKNENSRKNHMERYEAMQRGDTKYFTGRACKNGHVAERYTKSGNCSACLLENLQAAVTESAEAKAKFMENTEVIYVFAYDVDFDILKMFISTQCNVHLDAGLEAFKETFSREKLIADGVYRCKVRVPKAIKADIYKL